MRDDDDELQESSGPKSPWPLVVLLGIIFIPGALLAGAFVLLLRKWRQRPSVIAGIGVIVSLISVLTIALSWGGLTEAFAENGFGSKEAILGALQSLIPIWVGVSLILGSIAGWGAALFLAYQIKNNPHLTELEGSWRYKFTYRRTPRELMKRRRVVETLRAGDLLEPEKAPLGVSEEDDKPVFRYDSEARKHTMVTGTSGSGKSISLQSLIHSDIQNGKTAVVIDFKRDPEFASKLAAWSHANGREFYHFVNGEPEDYDIPYSKGQCIYDPLASGTPTSRADMLMGMREYDTSAAVWKAAMQQLLQVTFNMLHYADRTVADKIDWDHGGVRTLASVFREGGMQNLVTANNVEKPLGSTKYTVSAPSRGGIEGAAFINVNSPIAEDGRTLYEEMVTRGSNLGRARDELKGQLRTITASEYGQWMSPDPDSSTRSINLFDLTSEDGNVVLFSLNSDSEKEFSQFVGSMIFSDLTNVSAMRRNKGMKNHVNVYVDEFQAVPPETVTSLLEKSRASWLAMTLALQSFDQIVAAADKNGESHLTSMLDTCSNFITHAGATTSSATRLAEILGKHYVTVSSQANANSSGFLAFNFLNLQSSKVTKRQEERWVRSPEEFMKLMAPDKKANNNKSTAVWTTKTSADPRFASKGGASAQKVWMIPNAEVLEEYYRKDEHPILEEARMVGKKERTEVRPASAPVTSAPSGEPDPVYSAAPEYDNYGYEYEDDGAADEDWGFEDIPDSELDPEEAALPEETTPPASFPKSSQGLPTLPSQGLQTPSAPKRPAQGLPNLGETPLPKAPSDPRPVSPAPAPKGPEEYDLSDLFSGAAAPEPPPAEKKRSPGRPPKNPEPPQDLGGGLPSLGDLGL